MPSTPVYLDKSFHLLTYDILQDMSMYKIQVYLYRPRHTDVLHVQTINCIHRYLTSRGKASRKYSMYSKHIKQVKLLAEVLQCDNSCTDKIYYSYLSQLSQYRLERLCTTASVQQNIQPSIYCKTMAKHSLGPSHRGTFLNLYIFRFLLQIVVQIVAHCII